MIHNKEDRVPREVKILMRVVSKNTNELKTGLPGRFGIDVSTLGSQHLNDRVDFRDCRLA